MMELALMGCSFVVGVIVGIIGRLRRKSKASPTTPFDFRKVDQMLRRIDEETARLEREQRSDELGVPAWRPVPPPPWGSAAPVACEVCGDSFLPAISSEICGPCADDLDEQDLEARSLYDGHVTFGHPLP